MRAVALVLGDGPGGEWGLHGLCALGGELIHATVLKEMSSDMHVDAGPGSRIVAHSSQSGLEVEVEVLRATEPIRASVAEMTISFNPCHRTQQPVGWFQRQCKAAVEFWSSLLFELRPRLDETYRAVEHETSRISQLPLPASAPAKPLLLPHAYRSYDEVRGDFLRLEQKCDDFLRLVVTLFAAIIAGIGTGAVARGWLVNLATLAVLLAAVILALSRRASPKPGLTPINDLREAARNESVDDDWLASCLALVEREVQVACAIRTQHLNAAIVLIVAAFVLLAAQAIS